MNSSHGLREFHELFFISEIRVIRGYYSSVFHRFKWQMAAKNNNGHQVLIRG